MQADKIEEPRTLGPSGGPFHAFAATCEQVAATSSRLAKAALVRDYLAGLADPDLVIVARFFTGRPFAQADARVLNVGYALVRDMVCALAELDPADFGRFATEHGEAGAAAEIALAGRLADASTLTLLRVMDIYPFRSSSSVSGARPSATNCSPASPWSSSPTTCSTRTARCCSSCLWRSGERAWRYSSAELPASFLARAAAPPRCSPAWTRSTQSTRCSRRRGHAATRGWWSKTPPRATCRGAAAEVGNGGRRRFLSDYTFSVRASESDPTLLNVGKAYSGLTDAEIQRLTDWFKAHTLQDFGRVRLVEPQVVLEVAFDTVQPSKRHKSGYALRFPRIVRIRDDKTPAEIDTLETVRRLAEAAGASGEGEAE